MIKNTIAAVHGEETLRKFVHECPEHYFIFTPLNARPFLAIWSTKRPVFVSTLVQRLLRLERTCARFFTSPLRPCPLGPFFAMPVLYLPRLWATALSTALPDGDCGKLIDEVEHIERQVVADHVADIELQYERKKN